MDDLRRSRLATRMQRAALLEPALYNEVEVDPAATGQALQAVLLAAVASGLGTWLGWALVGRGGDGFGQLVGEAISMVVNWFVWSYVTYFVGTRLFGGRATSDELLRTLGFAMSPHVLSVLGFLPLLGFFVRLLVFCWVLVAGVVAVREALDVDTGAAIGTVVIGAVLMAAIWIAQWLILGLLGLPFRVLLAPWPLAVV